MAQIAFKGNPVNTSGELPKVGTQAPNFHLVKTDLSSVSLSDYKGKKVILNVFPSLDTSVCAAGVRKFNIEAAKTTDTVILAISKDLPFAHARFCSTEGIDNVIPASAFRDTDFEQSYGVMMLDGPLAGSLARAVIVIDENGKIIYEELVPEITTEPNYAAAIEHAK
jgi:thiol peroxidase